jgi:peptidoglycan/LPS O-acetylase OafA/YrhL
VVLFALGMAAASLAYSDNRGERRLRERLPWLWLAAGCAALFAGVKLAGIGGDPSSPRYLYEISLLETTLGAALMCLLVALARQRATKRLSLAAAIGNPLLVSVGHISFSLYLIHAPVLALVALGCRVLGLPRLFTFPVIVVFGALLAIGLAYLFHLAFERPFMSSSARRAVAPVPPSATVAAN